jgi:hypothetical protein
MVHIKRIARYSLWGAAILMVLAVGLHLLLPYLLNTRPIKEQLLARAHQAIDGDVDFEEIRIGLFPLPHAKVIHGRISFAGRMELLLDSVAFHLKTRPLLMGRLEMDTVLLRAPRLTVWLPSTEKAPPPGDLPDDRAAAALAAALAGLPGDSRLVITKGRLDVLKQDALLIRIDDLAAMVGTRDDALRVDLRGRADPIDHLQVRLTLPRPAVSGAPPVTRQTGEAAALKVAIEAQDADVGLLRQMVMDLLAAAETPTVLDVLRGGTLKDVTLDATGPSWADLARLEAMQIRARMVDGQIRVQGADLDLTSVSGDIAINGGVLDARQVSARMGATTGRQGVLTMGLMDDPATMTLGIDLDADLGQLPPLLERVVKNRGVLDELDRVKTLRGRATGRLRLKGTVTALVVEAETDHLEIVAEYDRLPYPLAILDGQVHYAGSGMRFENIEGRLQGSTFEQLTAELLWQDDPRIAIEDLAARIDWAEIHPWVADRFARMPQAAAMPGVTGWLNLAHTRIDGPLADPAQWHVQTHAVLELPGALTVNGVLASGPGYFNIRELVISDTQSDVRLAVRYDAPERAWDLGFTGRLAQRTLSGLWPDALTEGGWIQGEWNARYQLDAPWQSVLEGTVEIADLGVSLTAGDPLQIHHLDLDASGNRLDIRTLDLSWHGQRGTLAGKVVVNRDAVDWDMALSAEALDLGKLLPALDRAGQGERAPVEKPRMRGTVAAHVDRLTYGHYLWAPMRATLAFDRQWAHLTVTEAEVCGVSTVGTLEWAPGGMQLTLVPSAQNQALRYAGGCLTGAPSTERLEGTYTVSGGLTATGDSAGALISNLQGTVDLDVKDGRVYNIGEAGLFTNILSFIKLNNLVRGDLPNMRERDFKYRSMELKLRFQGSQVELREARLIADAFNLVGEGTVDLPSRQLDLTVLVSPLTTIDAIIKHIPIVGRILQGTLVAIPVGVRGPLSDPQVLPLSPKAVGARLMGILERTLKAPFRLIEPILPSAPERNDDAQRTTNDK